MGITVSVIYRSVRSYHQGIKAAKYLETRLLERDIKVHLVEWEQRSISGSLWGNWECRQYLLCSLFR